MSARTFVRRWSWRQVRKEWRQYIVILAMLTIAVAAAVTAMLTVYNLTGGSSEWGNGGAEVTTEDEEALIRVLESSDTAYGVIHEVEVDRAGVVGSVQVRATEPNNPITDPLATLTDGRWPAGDDEIAITDGVFFDQLKIGESVELGGRSVEIVGEVENTLQLSEEFVFALDPAVFEVQSDSGRRFLVAEFNEELLSLSNIGVSTNDGPSDRTVFTIMVNVVIAFAMLEVALLVGAGFAVIARRRTRQYGLLAAAGAPPSMVKSAAATTGAIIGVVGTVTGFVLGIAIVSMLLPAMETTVDQRISLAIPPLALLPTLLLGVLVPTLAARRPAKALNRLSIAALLSSTRPRPDPVGRLAVLGVVLAGLGAVMFVVGFNNEDGLFAVVGVLLGPIGLLLLAPLLVKGMGRLAARFPLSERLAGRSMARYNRRSASMVAALGLALAIPMGLAVVTTSIDQRAKARPPSLADDQLIVWGEDVVPSDFVLAEVDPIAIAAAGETLSASVPELDLTPIQVVVPNPDDSFNEEGRTMQFPILGGELYNGSNECNFCSINTIGNDKEEWLAEIAWVATPEMLDALGLSDQWDDKTASALVRGPGHAAIKDGERFQVFDNVQVATEWPRATAIPEVLISPSFAGEEQPTTIGWLAISDGPLSDATIDKVRRSDLSGVKLALPGPPASRWTLRALGLAIGSLVGLGITGSVVVLLANELARDSALLASLGASPRTGRRMMAGIAGQLALIGGLIAVAIGYLPLAPMMSEPVDQFPFVVPWGSLLVVLVIFPLAAAAMGWLLSRRAARGLSLRYFV